MKQLITMDDYFASFSGREKHDKLFNKTLYASLKKYKKKITFRKIFREMVKTELVYGGLTDDIKDWENVAQEKMNQFCYTHECGDYCKFVLFLPFYNVPISSEPCCLLACEIGIFANPDDGDKFAMGLHVRHGMIRPDQINEVMKFAREFGKDMQKLIQMALNTVYTKYKKDFKKAKKDYQELKDKGER